jgi:hypothetical protein
LRHEFEFLKHSAAPNLHATSFTGILDKLTLKIYDISMFSLLHLGAYRFNYAPKGPIIRNEIQHILSTGSSENKLDVDKESGKILVLGLHTPALFFSALKILKE